MLAKILKRYHSRNGINDIVDVPTPTLTPSALENNVRTDPGGVIVIKRFFVVTGCFVPSLF